MTCKRYAWIRSCLLLGLLSATAAADVRLPRLFSDGMVLQRDRPVPVWGWADPGEAVTVEFAGQKKTVTADAGGNWMALLDPLSASVTPQTFHVSHLTLHDVLVGDVFQVSGQSNAAMSLGACLRSPGTREDIESTTLPRVRVFQVPAGLFKDRPQADVPENCAWTALDPKVNAGISAVAFYIGRELHQHLKVPIGIVRASHAGGRAEIKMPEEALLSYGGGREFHAAGLAWFKTHPADRKKDGTVNGRYPSSDWNASIAPVIRFGKRGIFWYQGEHNAGDTSAAYAETLTTLIRSWREACGQPEMPFVVVQLPAYGGGKDWEFLREAQRTVVKTTKNAAMVVTIDHGEKDDIHPADKKPVGERLALEARRLIYGEPVTGCGPLYDGYRVEGSNIVVRFRDAAGAPALLKSRGVPLDGFTIAGEDQAFVPATAVIRDDTVIVSCPAVAKPVAVRYAWAGFPTVSLYDAQGLPASPFRTDDARGDEAANVLKSSPVQDTSTMPAALHAAEPAQGVDPKSLPLLPLDAVPIAEGPCQPTWKSLGDHFKPPAWWREAKIGVWLFWGPMSVGEDGDWYAKWIYMPKHAWGDFTRVYPHHVERFGHPSQFGFKDILPLWKAEKWDPDKLMALYRRAGARYVLAQGQHHDNFDNWNSKYQPWNSVNIGPKRDIVGDWKKAADKQDMRFGIAFHGDYALWWYQPAFLADLEGPLKGVSYDGVQNYDGKGTWWQKMGLDLKDLYGIDLKDEVVFPADFTGDPNEFRMRNPLGHGIPDGNLKKHADFAQWFATKFANRVIDAIDGYSPDFIFFDGAGSYPFCGHFTGRGLRADVVPRVIAHLYNTSMARHGGRLEAMAFTKGNEDPRAVAVNCEARVFSEIKRDQPWHTENTVGDWVYRPGLFYDTGMVIHQMLEAIARDGNYIINLPLTPAGTLDPGGVKVLEEMGAWMDIHGEGIYGSSAWDVWGEGATVMKGGVLAKQHAETPYTGADIRFVAKNGCVYAYLMAWPADGRVLIRSLAKPAGQITDVTLLGCSQRLDWRQTGKGLAITLPATKPCRFAYGLRVVGANLKAVKESEAKGAAPFSTVGEWETGTLPGHVATAPALYSSDPMATATWQPNLRHEGPVRIGFYLVVHPTGTTGARVDLTGAASPLSASFDLSVGNSRWEPVGIAQFQGTGEEQIRLRGNGWGFLRASAVRLEILDPNNTRVVRKTLILDNTRR